MGARLATQIKPADGFGQKALSPSGAAVVGQEFVAVAGESRTASQRVCWTCSTVVQHATPEISYLRQTTRTNNAAVVAAGALKPTSVYSVTRIENSLAVIAHLSEGIPRHWVLDNASLESWLDNELRYGLQVAVEAKVLADINGTSGIQVQTFSTGVLADPAQGHHQSRSRRLHAERVRTAPDRLGRCRAGAVLDQQHRARRPAVRPGQPPPIRRAGDDEPGGDSRCWAPVVKRRSRFGHRQPRCGRAVDENATADSFGKNLVFARCESRYATSVFSPLGVVKLAFS